MADWEVERVKEVTPEEMAWFGITPKGVVHEASTDAPIKVKETPKAEVLVVAKKRGRPAKQHSARA